MSTFPSDLAQTFEHVCVVFRPNPRRSLAVDFRQGQVFIDETVASGTAPRGIWLMGPARPKAKAYAEKRKTYLLQRRQFS